jgi:predicted amidohydrolase
MYKVGVLQFRPKLLKLDENLLTLENMLNDVEADLVVLPELATSGYVFNTKEEVESVAEDAMSGKTAILFSRLAEERNCSFVVGFVEKEGDKLFNSCSLFNPDGMIFTYRKTHLFYEEKLFFEPGNSGFGVFPAKGGVKVGMMICFDWQFPESARTLSLRGAQIIAHPANLVLPWCQKAMTIRSLENRVFSITSNRIGTEVNGEKELYFTGMSQILNIKGEVLSSLNKTEETISFVRIDPSDAFNKYVTDYNDAFKDRRSDLYKN